MGRIIAIANQKGGVGKTTTAVNLAASLAVAEKRILLIDMDPQGNATSAFGIEVADVETAQIYNVLIGEATLASVLRPTEMKTLWVAPATGNLIGFEVEGLSLDRREYRLHEALAAIRDQYDVILLDTPPSLGLLTINALTAADGVLVPLQSEYFALEGLGRLTGTIDLIRQQLNPSLSLDGIVLTMFDRRNNLAHQVAREVETHFSKALWVTRIPRNVKLSEAPSFGKPILLYDIRSVGSQAYLELANEFLSRTAAAAAQVVTGGTSDERTQSIGTGTLIPHSDGPASEKHV